LSGNQKSKIAKKTAKKAEKQAEKKEKGEREKGRSNSDFLPSIT
jgi:hypothetical protein